MHQVGAAVHQALDQAVVVAALAFDHVAGQRPGAARKANQRHAAVQRLADAGDGIEHVAQLVQVGRGELGYIGFIADGFGKARAFALSE
ncbi:hypothetical protein SDC9_175473 [bioreactor metagenome]|uniref:Uncharacterized protein n=1 Tax=bioreactor metagenome TaxID=1076179 RepID=A0A645GMS5_9ZZZZ